MKKILKVLLIIIAIPVVLVGGLLAYTAITDYKPEKVENVFKTDKADVLNDTLEYQLMVWNIGYCSLSADMDFFYDGGKNVRNTEENTKRNFEAVKNFVAKHDSIDFFLLQEVDKKSKRSYYIQQYDELSKLLSGYQSFFGVNYDVDFVPQPLTEPMGGVLSGVATFSKKIPSQSDRFSFPGNFDFPVGLFMLDRCFLVNRYPLENKKELIVINTHNSAYDDGTLRKGQMKYLKNILLEEYNKGNYIIVGGDWNQSPPNFKPQFNGHVFDDKDFMPIDADYLPNDWKWVYSAQIPTNRRVMIPYKKGETPTTVIDYFLISPNIESIDNKTIDLDFQNSDHQPIWIKIKLKK
jgi:endonuclease/exonuclease/phosphatase family metal-dependent hydrolase